MCLLKTHWQKKKGGDDVTFTVKFVLFLLKLLVGLMQYIVGLYHPAKTEFGDNHQQTFLKRFIEKFKILTGGWWNCLQESWTGETGKLASGALCSRWVSLADRRSSVLTMWWDYEEEASKAPEVEAGWERMADVTTDPVFSFAEGVVFESGQARDWLEWSERRVCCFLKDSRRSSVEADQIESRDSWPNTKDWNEEQGGDSVTPSRTLKGAQGR